MKKPMPIIPLYKQFVRDSERGKRLKKNGEKVSKGTIKNYKNLLKTLEGFIESTSFELRICDVSKLTKRERLSEKNYWKKFYRKFTEYLYSRGCYDNYVGSTIKQIRVFFNYLKEEKDIETGDFHRHFYVRKQEVAILVLSPDQLKFLIHDEDFHNKLSKNLKFIKDVFVFGCTTGLRYSDVFRLTNKNFEQQQDDWYLKIKSQKTKTYSFIKLPEYAVNIYMRHRSRSSTSLVFKKVRLHKFNKDIKQIGRLAGFTEPVELTREQLGVPKRLDKKPLRFCDKMSSHMMRRTAITTMLILGMPEHLVRKVSGHSNNSKSFGRYVHYAQVYIDKEIDKVHDKLQQYA